MVSSQEALNAVIGRALAAGVVAIDTEFVWNRTYYPRLGVIQLGLGEGDVELLDAVELADLTPLGRLLADGGVTKILHDAVQDLTILRRATGAYPVNVFDSQIAAGFVGLSSTVSLQDLVAETIDVDLPKGATRSDWCRRPLSETQIAYAEDDVRYLPAIRLRLLERAESMGHRPWLEQEMERLDDPALYEEPNPRLQHTRLKAPGLNRLSGSQRAVLRELAAWREEAARAENRPRRNILADDVLVEVARRHPASTKELNVRGLHDRDRGRYGDALLAAVERGRAVASSDQPEGPASHAGDDRINATLQLVQAAVAGRCARQGIDSALVAAKADLRDVIAEERARDGAHPLFQGWRREFVGEDIAVLLSGEAVVSISREDSWPDLLRPDGRFVSEC